jgi:hypothetical protein
VAEAEILERISFVSADQGEHRKRLEKIEELLKEDRHLLEQILARLPPPLTFPQPVSIVVTPQ